MYSLSMEKKCDKLFRCCEWTFAQWNLIVVVVVFIMSKSINIHVQIDVKMMVLLLMNKKVQSIFISVGAIATLSKNKRVCIVNKSTLT